MLLWGREGEEGEEVVELRGVEVGGVGDGRKDGGEKAGGGAEEELWGEEVPG